MRALNRLEATLTLQDTIDQNAYYAVAFDDAPGDGTGPGGIEGNTSIVNGIVGGNFRLAIVYHLNQFLIFYRTDPTDYTTEQQILSTTDPLFAVTPRATSNGIDFTLNLDARLNATTYFFPRGTDGTTLNLDRVDLNFVTSNVVIRDGNDNRVKPVDAAGFQTISPSTSVSDFQVNTTRNTNITDPADDERPNVDSSFNSFNFGSIDVTNLQVRITRASS